MPTVAPSARPEKLATPLLHASARRPGGPATFCQPPTAGRRRPSRAAHPWREHRECAPADALAVERAAERHPHWLPRRHPEARGPANRHVGFRESAPAGAYARVPTWRSREHWLAFTVPVAAGLHPAVLARHGVSAELLRRWARIKSLYGWSNGRHVVVRPDTLASVLGVSERQVQRLNGAARALGLEVVIVVGRMLTLEERAVAYDAGSRQRGLASEVALSIPQDQRGLVDHVTPPRGSYLPTNSDVDLLPLHRLTAAKTGEAASRPRPRKGRRRSPGPGFRLAQALVGTVGWLNSERPWRLAGLLGRFATAATPWTAQHVAQVLAAADYRLGRSSITAHSIKTRPAVVLAAKLRDLDPVADHPGLGVGPLVATTPDPCGHPSCDGYGWLRDLIEINGYSTARKCPRCPPVIRRNP